MNKTSKTEPRRFAPLRFFSKSGLYQSYKEKCNFFSCSRNWNCKSNPICDPKIAQRMAWIRKKLFENLSSTLYFEKTKTTKKIPASKLSLNLSFKDVLRLQKKRHYFLILIYTPDIIHRTLKEVRTWNNSLFSG